MMDILFAIIGLALILGGANYLTDGSAALAKRFNIPEFIIGLTIVAVGTSTPELVVSIMSALSGSGTMAIGNVVGSNLFNTLVILGICSVVAPIALTKNNIKIDIPYGVLASGVLLLIATRGEISQTYGVVMVMIYVAIIFSSIKTALRDRHSVEAEKIGDESTSQMALWLSLVMIVGGLGALIFGGDMLLDAAINIATSFGIPQNIIAITLLAGGTSMPELASSLVSLAKGKSDIALGGVIGSNIANIFLVLGASASITPLSLGQITLIDLGVVLLASLVLFVAAFTFKKHKIDRVEGVIMLVGYVAYMIYLLK